MRSEFVRLLSVERRKLFGRALPWAEVLIFALLVGILHIAIIAALQQGNAREMPPQVADEIRRMLYWPQGLKNALTFANGGEIGGLFVIVLVGAFMAQEYTWHSVHLWLSRGVSRTAYLLAKAAIAILFLGAFVLVAVLVGGGVTAVFTYAELGTLPLQEVDALGLVGDMVVVGYTLVPYAALAFLLAVASRSTMVTIGVGLGYTLLIENMVAEILSLFSPEVASVTRYLPTMLTKSLTQHITAGSEVTVGIQGASTVSLLQPETAAVLLAVYTVLLLGASVWLFRRQDMTV